jgi:hypothetical protein
MTRSLVFVALLATAGCSYPDFAFQPGADAIAADTEIDSSVADGGGDIFATEDTADDSAVADTDVEAAPDVGVDTAKEAEAAAPECTTNLDCGCGTVCVTGKCVASDCTKDNHF